MAWEMTLYSFLGFAGAGVSALIAGLAWRHRTQHGARPFVALMIALGSWALVYALQLGFGTRADQLFWQRIALGVGGLVPTLWLLFVLRYLGRDAWLTGTRKIALAVDPLLFGVLTLTNPSHGLVWHDATPTLTAAGPAFRLAFGLGYHVHIAYSYLLVATGIGLLGSVFVRSSPLYRRQTGFLILGALPPFVGNIAYTLRLPWGPLPAVDPTPFAFVITGVLFGLALFQFDLLERVPIARQRVLQEMGDGLVVLDADGVVVETNPIARRVLDPTPVVGRSIRDLAPGDGSRAEDAPTTRAALEALEGRTITVTLDGRRRAYDVEWSSLTDHRGETVGHALALRDVTDRNEYEQRLEVAQRVLRHNLRNDMNVIHGWADQLAETTTDGRASAARRIVETTNDLIELSEKTRTMVRIDGSAPGEHTTIDAASRLGALVAEFREEHPDVRIEFDESATAAIRLPSEDFFEIPVRNLIENAIEHNDDPAPWVRVRVTESGDRGRIHVDDNGPEIPAVEHEVLEDGTEGPLQHGSGVGLWLAYWSMRTVGGRISFDRREEGGNSVTLEFPRADLPASSAADAGVAPPG